MNYLTYPFNIMSITQSYTGSYSHSPNIEGSPKDYPIDDNGGSSKQTLYFYCPCDEMEVKRIYGVETSGTNTMWLESTSKVKTPSFEDYVTILLMHPEDEDLKKLSVGQKFKRGEKVTLEGKDGNATGYHFHMSVGRGKFTGNGWTKNTEGGWVITTTEGGVKPEDAFYLDKSFTDVSEDKDINFLILPNELPQIEGSIGYVTAYSLNVRKGPGLEYDHFNTLPEHTKINILEEEDGWYRFGENQWVYAEYVTDVAPKYHYELKEVNVNTRLNVRKTPDGEKVSKNAPLPDNTLVASIKEENDWTLINTNRWVYSYYLK